MKNFIKNLLIIGMIATSSRTCSASEDCNTIQAYKVQESRSEFKQFLHEITPRYKAYVDAYNRCHENYIKASKMVKDGCQIDAALKQLAFKDKNNAQEKLKEYKQNVCVFQNSSDDLIRELVKAILKLSIYQNDALEQIYAYIENNNAVLNSHDAIIQLNNNAVLFTEQSQYIDNLYDLLLAAEVRKMLKIK